VKSWASSLVGGSRRDTLLRAGLAVVLVGALVWFLPVRRPGEEAGHHAGHAPPALDPFERAGVSELKDGQRAPRFVLSTLDGSGGSTAGAGSWSSASRWIGARRGR